MEPDAGAPSAEGGVEPLRAFDLVVLSDAGGAGGAAAAALGAASRGRKAALVMEPVMATAGEELGAGHGADCCALALLRRAATVAFDMRDARVFGWAAEAAAVAAAVGSAGAGAGTCGAAAAATPVGDKCRYDWTALAEAARRYGVAAALRRRSQLAAAGVVVLEGRAEWGGGGLLRVHCSAGTLSGVPECCTLRAEAFVVTPPSPPPHGAAVRGAAALLARARPPGRALVLGATPRAVETAASLAALGAEVTLMARDSEILPGHDHQMARLMRKHLEEMLGISFRLGYQMEALGRVAEAGEEYEERVRVRATAAASDGASVDAEFDTVLFGEEGELTRDGHFDSLHRGPGWLPTHEAVGAPVFAVGSSAGEGAALARRLFDAETPAAPPAPPADAPAPPPAPSIGAVRAPVVEYGFVGLSEEQARAKLGSDGIELYSSHFCPLEWAVHARESPVASGGSRCRYVKMVCARARGSGNERVLGLHVLAPRAAEIAQGFSIALRLGASCADFLALAGLHATSAERVTAQGVAKAPTAGADAASEAAC